jgi:hypothetical protein
MNRCSPFGIDNQREYARKSVTKDWGYSFNDIKDQQVCDFLEGGIPDNAWICSLNLPQPLCDEYLLNDIASIGSWAMDDSSSWSNVNSCAKSISGEYSYTPMDDESLESTYIWMVVILGIQS